MQVETSSAHSDDLLHGMALQKLSQADRNLATALVMGVLRWQIALDAELAKLLDRPDQPLPEEIRIALRMGAFQLRHMDRIPPHAALSESVELVRAAGHPKAAGLVNAILRKLSATPGRRKPIAESVDAMATRLGHPAWLVKRWESFYGREAASAICEYDQHEPTRGELFAHDQTAEDVDANLIDDGSRLIAELAAASHPSPERIWDACAAPGGKTSVLARRHPAAELLATDLSPKRLQAMRRRLENELPNREIRTLVSDAAQLPASEGNFDLILCDVPCSGTGTLARNPEIRHRLQPSEFERQADRQREILSAALKRLRPGGRLLYSTCSLEPEENEEIVKSVLAKIGDAKPADALHRRAVGTASFQRRDSRQRRSPEAANARQHIADPAGRELPRRRILRRCIHSRDVIDYCGVVAGVAGVAAGAVPVDVCPKVSFTTEPLLARCPASGDCAVTGPTGTICTGAACSGAAAAAPFGLAGAPGFGGVSGCCPAAGAFTAGAGCTTGAISPSAATRSPSEIAARFAEVQLMPTNDGITNASEAPAPC